MEKDSVPQAKGEPVSNSTEKDVSGPEATAPVLKTKSPDGVAKH